MSVLSVCFQPDNYLIESTGNVFLSVTFLSLRHFILLSGEAEQLIVWNAVWSFLTEVENRSVLVQ